MLQIISGKFYGNNIKHNNPKEIDIYSNVNLKKEIQICHFTLVPYEENEGIFSYKVKFDNCIEQQPGGFSLVDVGSDTVIYQLKHIFTFLFDAYFDIDKYAINTICKEKITDNRMTKAPSNYVRTLLDKNIEVTDKQITKIQTLFQCIVDLRREDYERISECIRSYCASIILLEEDPNLAYCMLVFVLESLSQDYNAYEPIWSDYNEATRNKMEKIYKKLDAEVVEEIKKTLTKEAHLKLMQRFLHFIIENLTEDFYMEEGVGNKILRDDIEPALKNAYNIRSKYAHSLRKIIDQSAMDNVSRNSDFFKQMHQPYFTYSGLLRLTHHVIINIITKLEKVEKEKIDWIGKLPGMVTCHLAPEFWLSNMENEDCKRANIRFQGYVEKLAEYKAYDISKVMELYISKFSNVPENLKKPIFALALLLENVTEFKGSYEEFINANIERLGICCIENMAALSLSCNKLFSIYWDNTKLEEVMESYIKNKHKDKSYLFPTCVETCMYLLTAKFFAEEPDKMEKWEEKAKFNSANDKEILCVVMSNVSIDMKVKQIWDIIAVRCGV